MLSEFWKKGEFWTPVPQGGLGCPSLAFCSSFPTTFLPSLPPPPPPTSAAVCCHCQRLSLLFLGSSFSISRTVHLRLSRAAFSEFPVSYMHKMGIRTLGKKLGPLANAWWSLCDCRIESMVVWLTFVRSSSIFQALEKNASI